MKIFLDLIFPPLCLSCRERCSTKHFCPSCWELCAPPDPAERCRHCFGDLDRNGAICFRCARDPILPISRAFVFDEEAPIRKVWKEAADAIAGFALNQWLRLEWPMPDAVVPMPDPDSEQIGKAFAKLLERPFIKALRSFGGGGGLKEGALKEDQEVLLFDAVNPVERLQKASLTLSEAFPKRTYLLSLIRFY